jgi:hypothetical protein
MDHQVKGRFIRLNNAPCTLNNQPSLTPTHKRNSENPSLRSPVQAIRGCQRHEYLANLVVPVLHHSSVTMNVSEAFLTSEIINKTTTARGVETDNILRVGDYNGRLLTVISTCGFYILVIKNCVICIKPWFSKSCIIPKHDLPWKLVITWSSVRLQTNNPGTVDLIRR